VADGMPEVNKHSIGMSDQADPNVTREQALLAAASQPPTPRRRPVTVRCRLAAPSPPVHTDGYGGVLRLAATLRLLDPTELSREGLDRAAAASPNFSSGSTFFI
jgi:hypothetical protein